MTQTRARRYVPGDHKVLCDLCGLTYMRSETKLQWNNLLACSECFDPKHPQLNIRGKADRQAVDIARPESENDNDLTFYAPPSPFLQYSGFVTDDSGILLSVGVLFDSGVIIDGNY